MWKEVVLADDALTNSPGVRLPRKEDINLAVLKELIRQCSIGISAWEGVRWSEELVMGLC
jgi:hypothetical protein